MSSGPEEIAKAADKFILRKIAAIVKESAPGADEIVVRALTKVYYNETVENLARRQGLMVYP